MDELVFDLNDEFETAMKLAHDTVKVVDTEKSCMYVGSIARVGKITTIIPSTEVSIKVSTEHNMYVGSYVRTVKIITIQGG